MDASGGDGGSAVEEGVGAGEGAAEGVGESVIVGERWVIERGEKRIAVEERGGEAMAAVANAAMNGCLGEGNEEETEEN